MAAITNSAKIVHFLKLVNFGEGLMNFQVSLGPTHWARTWNVKKKN